jgi:hypothetical protein
MQIKNTRVDMPPLFLFCTNPYHPPL